MHRAGEGDYGPERKTPLGEIGIDGQLVAHCSLTGARHDHCLGTSPDLRCCRASEVLNHDLDLLSNVRWVKRDEASDCGSSLRLDHLWIVSSRLRNLPERLVGRVIAEDVKDETFL